MKKKVIRSLGLVLAILMLGSILASCGEKQPAATEKDDTVYEVIANLTLGEPVSPNWARLFKELEEKSDGRLKVTPYWSGSLIPIPEIPKSMSTGAAAFSNLPTPNYVDVLPLNCRILQLPFIGLQDAEGSAEIYMQLVDEFPELRKEYEDFNMIPIAATTLGMYDLHFADKKPVHLPSDLNGRKIVPYKLEFLPLFESNNAAGSYIPPAQMYESLEKAVVDGYINNWAFQGWFGLTDVVSQHVEFGDYGAFQEFNVIVLNADFYNSLPEDLQKLFIDTYRTNKGYLDLWKDTSDLVANEKKKATDKGDIIYKLTPEELEVWKEAVLPVNEIALKEVCDLRGDDVAYKIYDRCLEIIAERYGA